MPFIDRIKPSLGNKLFFYTLLLSLLPLCIAGVVLLRIERQNLITQAERELNITAQAMRIELEQYVRELQIDAQLLAKSPAIQSMSPSQQLPYLQLALNHYHRYGQLAIVDLNGQIELTAKEQELINISHIESFRKARDGEQAFVVAPALFNDMLPVLHMHTPIMSDGGEGAGPVGVLGSPSPFSRVSPILDKYDHDMPGSVFVLGDDNRVLIHPDPDVRLSRPDFSEIVGSDELIAAGPVRIESPNENTRYGFFTEKDVSFLAAFTRLDGLGWTIVVKKRMSVVLAPMRLIQNVGFILVSSLIGLNLLLLWFVHRRLTRPVDALAYAVRELEAGNMRVSLPSNGRGQAEEIGQLIQSFASMRSAVADREQKLQKFTETLEDKIVLRTAELQNLNSYLEKEIEEHKRTEAELARSRDELAVASRAKDTFLARMSHELRTPLNAIIGYAELLEEDAAEGREMSAAEDARIIKRAAHHLTNIISNILDYSEIQSKSVHLNQSHFALEGLIEHVVALIEPLAEKNHNKMVVNNGSPDAFLFSDELKLRQILTHLLDNAAKFTSHGTISLDVFIDEDRDKKSMKTPPLRCWLMIVVQDTGIGIQPETVESIFHPFSQVDESFERPHEGLGLGLVLTRNFVDILEGEITVESQIGEGSKFEVKIPLDVVPI